MRRFILPLILFTLFIIEGTIMQVFAPDRYGQDFLVIPRFAFIIVVFISIFWGRTTGTVYALILGVMEDVIYTQLLGVYAFSMALVVYLLAFSYKIFKTNVLLLMITAIVATIFLDYLVYGIYSIIGITDFFHDRFFYVRLLPSIVVNLVFVIIFVYPMRKLLQFLQKKEDIEEKMS